MFPAGETVAVSQAAARVKIKPVTGSGSTTCTMNGGDFQIPTKYSNLEGPITSNYTTDPTFSSCVAQNVTTSGTWTLTVQALSSATPTLTIPVEGITVNGTCTNREAITMTGTTGWWNGFFVEGIGNYHSFATLGPSTKVMWGPNCFGSGLPETIEMSAPGMISFTNTVNPLTTDVDVGY